MQCARDGYAVRCARAKTVLGLLCANVLRCDVFDCLLTDDVILRKFSFRGTNVAGTTC